MTKLQFASQSLHSTFDWRTSMTLKAFSAPSEMPHGTMTSRGANTTRAETESAGFTSNS